ncbi:MAG: NAD(P)-dependent oxidoreductase [Candidatus Latescibacteria bacterium]|nr:NAD(P)-dependent oxidoreductase [Candidatus Latescibacterota bacterium]
MRVVVTGVAGYVGSTLTTALLAAGYRVCGLDNLSQGGRGLLGFWSHPAFEFVRGDIQDEDLLRDALKEVDAVVHLAAIVGDPACARQPDLARSINLDASLKVLDICRHSGVRRFVFASTCSNYGRMADPAQYVSETSELRPISLYAETKVAVEKRTLERAPSATFYPTVLRFATVYGVSPRMRFDLTVNEFTANLLVKGHLLVYGEQFWRPYIHVRDVARAVLAVLEAPAEKVAGEVFNVGDTSENYRKQDLVVLLQRHLPNARVEYVRRDEDPRDYRVCFDKITNALGYRITRQVEDGIREVISLIQHGIITDIEDPSYRN